jgi:hypothetical protein
MKTEKTVLESMEVDYNQIVPIIISVRETVIQDEPLGAMPTLGRLNYMGQTGEFLD